jgi:hypothetical protein
MILLALLAQAAASMPLADFAELPPQKLSGSGCVIFLWTKGKPPRRIAMADETARTLLVQYRGRPLQLASTGPTSYASTSLSITLDLDIVGREGLSEGALISQGSMRVEEPGKDSSVVPVGGIRGCQ